MNKFIFIALVSILSACNSFKLKTSFEDVKVTTVGDQLIIENTELKRV